MLIGGSMMEKQKSIIVLHQKKEKANGESADGLRNMGDIRKGSKVRWERKTGERGVNRCERQ